MDGGDGADRLDLRDMTQGIVHVGKGDSVDVPVGADTQILWSVGQDASLDLTGAGSGQIMPFIGKGASVTGTAQSDSMTTEGDGVTLRGGDGNDTLIGNYDSYTNAPTHTKPYDTYLGLGNDLLGGGAGDDQITGDLGDTLTGGAGADSFTVWLDSGSVAHMTDFDAAEDSMTLHVNATAGNAPPDAITRAEVDGNTILRVNGEDRLVIEGRTGLNIGINRQEEGDQIGNDTGYQTPDGANADPSAMDILVERYTPYY